MTYTSKNIYDEYVRLHFNKSAAAKSLDLDWRTVDRHVRKYEEEISFKEEDFDVLKNAYIGFENAVDDYLEGEVPTISEEEELFNQFNLDPNRWVIERIIYNSWETPIKNETTGEVDSHTNNQSKVIFKRLIKDVTLDIIKEQYKILPKKYVPIKRTVNKNPFLYEIAIADHHFAKLAWDMETGESYDIKIAKKYYIDAVKDLLSKVSHLNIDKILMPIGNDLFNFDGIRNETTAGTPQDSDSRWTKVFRVVSETLIEVIDICRQVADVDIVIVPGNHDRASCFYLGEFLSAWYRLDKNVNVDNDPTLRKYYVYGKTLIGMSHGSEEKHASLPLLMAREAKEHWGNCDFYEYQIGHWHRKKTTEYVSGDTYNGVQVRVLPSLTGTDAWHYSKGFVKGIKSALGILYNKDDGHYGEFTTKVK